MEIFVVCNFRGQATDQHLKFHGYPRMKLVFSYKYMLGCKFSLLIDHPRKLNTAKISVYTVVVAIYLLKYLYAK